MKRRRLTRRNLALFSGTRRKKEKASALESAVDLTSSSTTETTSTTASGFAEQARENGILHPTHSRPPKNLDAILERHNKSRATASPPASDYQAFAEKVDIAANETTMMVETVPWLLKKYRGGYWRQFKQPFTALPDDVGFNNGLSAPQPDFVEGLQEHEFRPVSVSSIQGAVLYKDDPYAVTLPHIAGEWKGRGKDLDVARLQSAYDGAALVHGRNQALAYLGKADAPGHAEVTTFTTDGATLNFFAHYTALSEHGDLEYHQYHYAAADLRGSLKGYKAGRRGLRNAQDHAKEQSYALRGELKKHWRRRKSVEDNSLPATASAVEGEASYEEVDPGANGAQPPRSAAPTVRGADERSATKFLTHQPARRRPRDRQNPAARKRSPSSTRAVLHRGAVRAYTYLP